MDVWFTVELREFCGPVAGGCGDGWLVTGVFGDGVDVSLFDVDVERRWAVGGVSHERILRESSEI
jgi:hypothetical protein